MVPPPPAIAAAVDAAAPNQLNALRAQLAGAEAALATANDQLAARNTLAALNLAATASGDARHVGFSPPAGQGATDGPLAAGPAAATGATAGAPTHRPLAAAPASRDARGGDDDAAFLAAYDDEGASSAGGEWPRAVQPRWFSRPHAHCRSRRPSRRSRLCRRRL
eukprot:TRINITY_DN12894_c0_g1_i1.p2 TRINITY_DN12894_c0_g1~~TRINITY_DN12894_c0_g1_i1.p2  ORF type:complete len:165 (-),score=25.79 TRINITY_DN12894_c0_g1_i1:144-638(-)